MFNWLKKLLSKLLDLLKKLFKKLKELLGPLLPILIMGLFLFAGPIALSFSATLGPFMTSVFSTIGSWGPTMKAIAGGVTALVVAPSETRELVSDTIEVVGDAVTDIGGAVGEATGSFLNGVFSSAPTWMLVAGAIGLYFWLSSGDDDGVASVHVIAEDEEERNLASSSYILGGEI